MFQQLTTLNEVREVNASFPYTGPIKAWKEQGKKVVAFQHGYVPEEIIHAAGILPIGLTGLPTASATAVILSMSIWKFAGVSDCAPSDSAWSGFGGTSMMIASAPAATEARASGCTRYHLPVP